ncbi:MAG: hypothetical protein HY737_06215 [Candidatus Omnitrophica bacterium]|nr:hypothetical protein [Candidatus Omnitrophota bacterium]
MSLIEEALRKVQEPLLPKPASSSPSGKTTNVHSWSTGKTASQRAPATSRPAPLMLIIAVIIGVVASLGLVAGGVWLSRNLPTASPTAPQPMPAVVEPSPAMPSAAPLPEPSQEPPKDEASLLPPPTVPERLSLTGIAGSQGESYAMINGLILSVGERLGDYVVIEISQNSVRLQKNDGSETILRVPR